MASRVGRSLTIVALACVPALAAAQDPPPRMAGRVVDEATGEGVEGAAVTFRLQTNSVDVERVTDAYGLFEVERARSGVYLLTVGHIAYGLFQDSVTLVRGEGLALRIALSTTAITLDPVVVEAVGEETRRERASGTALRVLTARELAPAAETGIHLVGALSQLMPGMRVTSGRSTPGEILCLQFRNPVSLSEFGCLPPVVIVDNVRQANGLITLNTMPIASIRSVRAVPPGEAGVLYGSDSRYGVILIETFGGRSLGPDVTPLPSAGIYSWALESRPYPWARALALATVGNGLGLLAGYLVARECLSFDDLTDHFYEARCGTLGNAGARLAIYAAPQLGVGYLIHRTGETNLSSGSPWKNAVAGAIMSIPGVVLALTSEQDGFSGSKAIGSVMLSVGAPAAAVMADRLFRRRSP